MESKHTPSYYYSDGTISTEYDYNKALHRIDGPAVKYMIRIPSVNDETCCRAQYVTRWYIDDKEYLEQQFNQIISEAKALDPILQLTDPRWWVRELAKKTL